MARSRSAARSATAAALVAGVVGLGACGTEDAEYTGAAGDTAAPPTMSAPAGATAAAARRVGAAASGTFIDASGNEVGTVTLEEGAEGVLVHGRISGLAPGAHGFHLHEVGQCEPPFDSAGGHLNPTGRQHGLLTAAGPHAGDLANIVAGADGSAAFEAFAPLVSLGTGTDGLLGGDGAALLVHAGADDHRTDPSGDSGGRVACAVIGR